MIARTITEREFGFFLIFWTGALWALSRYRPWLFSDVRDDPLDEFTREFDGEQYEP